MGSFLKIHRTPLVLLLSGIVVSFPSIACGFSYVNVVDIIFFSFMFVCLSLYLVRHFRFGFLFGSILFLFSIANYQASIGFFTGFLVIFLIRDILLGESTKTVIIKALKHFVSLIIGMIAYLISMRIISGGELSSYANIDNLGGLALSNLPERFVFSYTNLVDIFLRNSLGLHQDYYLSGKIFQVMFIISGILAAVMIISIIINQKIYKKKSSLVLLVIALCILAPAINIISIISPDHLYILMQYSLILVFVFVLMLVDIAASEVVNVASKIHKKVVYLSSWLVLIFCFLFIFNYAIYTNTFYFKMEIVNEQGRAFSTTLITRLQSEEFYDENKTILLLGSPPENAALGAFHTMRAIPLGDIARTYSYRAYLLNYLGFPNFVTHDWNYAIPDELNTPEFTEFVANMPYYPLPGSIKEFEGYLLVNFSD
jgi:hypothetical protein